MWAPQRTLGPSTVTMGFTSVGKSDSDEGIPSRIQVEFHNLNL